MSEKTLDLSQSNQQLATACLIEPALNEPDKLDMTLLAQVLLYNRKNRDPKRYADICELAANELQPRERGEKTTHIAHIHLLLQVVNGLRRQAGLWDLEPALSTLRMASTVDTFTTFKGIEVVKLQIEIQRQTAMIYRLRGNYERAYLNHKSASRLARLNKLFAGATVFDFCADVDSANLALCDGDEVVVKKNLGILLDSYHTLFLPKFNGDEQVEYWRVANAPIHVLWAHFLAGKSLVEMGEGKTSGIVEFKEYTEMGFYLLQDFPLKPIAERFTHWLDILQIMWWLRILKIYEPLAKSHAFQLVDDNRHPDVVATALLMLAEIATKNRRLADATKYLNDIIELESHSAHVVRAIAKRRLEGLA